MKKNDLAIDYLKICTINLLIVANYIIWSINSPNKILFLLIFLGILLVLISAHKNKFFWVAAAFLAWGASLSISSGTPFWDARSIWLIHAKRIFYEGTLYAQLDDYPAFETHHDYPAIYPAISASIAYLIGYWNEVLPKFASVVMIISPILTFTTLLKKGMALLVFFTLSLLLYGQYFFNGYIDAIVSINLGALILIMLSLQQDSIDLDFFSTIFIIFSYQCVVILLKNEGVLALSLFALALFLTKSKYRFSFLFSLFCSYLFYYLSWGRFLSIYQIQNDMSQAGVAQRAYQRLLDFSSSKQILLELYNYSNLYIYLLIFITLISIKNLRAYCSAALFSLLYFLVLFFIYLSTPHDLGWHLMTSINRTIFVPCTAILCLTVFIIDNNYIDHRIQKIIDGKNNYGIFFITAFSWLIYSKFNFHLVNNFSYTFAGTAKNTNLIRNYGSELDGWSYVEPWGLWMVGSKGEVKIPISVMPAPKYIRMILRAYLPENISAQAITVSINGQIVSNAVLKQEYTTLSILVPQNITFIDRLKMDYLTLTIEPSSPISPASLKLGSDSRLLSVGLVEFQVLNGN